MTRRAGLGLLAAGIALAVSGCGGSSGTVVRPPASSSATATTSTPTSSPVTPVSRPTVAPHPKTVVKPAAGLHGGQMVTVTASGFSPGLTLLVVQCADKGQQTGSGDCNLSAAATIHTDAAGAATTSLTVTPGPFGSNGIVCSAKLHCLISVTQATLNPAEEADAPISFG
jgi:hypothetical protein